MKHQQTLLAQKFHLRPNEAVISEIEDRKMIQFEHCELNIFETRKVNFGFHLQFSELSVTAMIRGKKSMRLFGDNAFDYLPGEMVLVPSGEKMSIDFPEASPENPTQCIALNIESNFLKETIAQLNSDFPKTETLDSWKFDNQNFHLTACAETNETLGRLSVLQNNQDIKTRNLLASFTLKELIIRLMQTQAKNTLLEHSGRYAAWHRFAYVMEYIKTNLTEKIKVENLSKIACMSKPNFFKAFKREFGISPVDLIIKERIQLAKRLLKEENKSVSEACYLSGFNNMSHFFRLFRKEEGLTPKGYKISAQITEN